MVKKYLNINQLDGNTSLDTIFENKDTQTDDLDTNSSENTNLIEDKCSRPTDNTTMCERHVKPAYELDACVCG